MNTPGHRGSGGARLLIVPGLHDSGPGHWQSRLEQLHPGAVRVVQDHWDRPDLEAWAARMAATIERHGGDRQDWIVAAHSFGCLTTVRHLLARPDLPLAAVLLVAPADPNKFGVTERLLGRLPLSPVLIASETDPWMSPVAVRRWAHHWNSRFISIGDAGHINIDSGHGPLPLAEQWVTRQQQRLARRQRARHAGLGEWHFAI